MINKLDPRDATILSVILKDIKPHNYDKLVEELSKDGRKFLKRIQIFNKEEANEKFKN